MTASTHPTSNTPPVDEDLAEQAHRGHGVPSQDPAPAAQFPLEPKEVKREAHSVLVGGGVMAGAATGAAIGVASAGPVGVVVGATLGAVAGALGGAVASAAVTPEK
jgi:non-heme chloroperoxidase